MTCVFSQRTWTRRGAEHLRAAAFTLDSIIPSMVLVTQEPSDWLGRRWLVKVFLG